MLIPPSEVEKYYFGNPKLIADKILFIKRTNKLDSYKQHFSKTNDFGNIWNGFTGVYRGEKISIIATGIGPSLVGDCVSAIHRPGAIVLYTGTAGGLNNELKIGDYIIAQTSVCGDGYSLYFGHSFLSLIKSDENLIISLKKFIEKNHLSCRICKTFTTATVVKEAERSFWKWVDPSCEAIEMGAASFYAAALAGNKKPIAYFWITDFPLAENSFFKELPENEIKIKNIRYHQSVEIDLDLISGISG